MAYLGTKPANQVIDSTLIADGVITTADLANGAVTDAKIAAMAASKLTGQLPDANAPSGSVIQVVQATSTSYFGNNTTTMAQTNYSVQITPSSTSSRILVLMSISEMRVRGDVGGNIAIYRNGSEVVRVAQEIGYSAGGGGTQNTGTLGMSPTYSWLDSPSSTSALTYTVWARKLVGNSGTFEFLPNAGGGGQATMIAMEIAG
jgi:hypothetical protein